MAFDVSLNLDPFPLLTWPETKPVLRVNFMVFSKWLVIFLLTESSKKTLPTPVHLRTELIDHLLEYITSAFWSPKLIDPF